MHTPTTTTTEIMTTGSPLKPPGAPRGPKRTTKKRSAVKEPKKLHFPGGKKASAAWDAALQALEEEAASRMGTM